MKKAIWLLSFALGACGVRGDPIPPGTPAEIGKGRKDFLEKRLRPSKTLQNEGVVLDPLDEKEENGKKNP